MRRIKKGPEPKSWAEYRLSTPGATFNTAPKDELRRALLAEQGHVCCYCMCRLDEDTTRIEHRVPREENNVAQHFVYRNLLAACLGSEGLGDDVEHCDVYKHDTQITFDPADPARDFEQFLRYNSASGAISSTDTGIDNDITETLKLNRDWIKEARQEVLTGFKVGFER